MFETGPLRVKATQKARPKAKTKRGLTQMMKTTRKYQTLTEQKKEINQKEINQKKAHEHRSKKRKADKTKTRKETHSPLNPDHPPAHPHR